MKSLLFSDWVTKRFKFDRSNVASLSGPKLPTGKMAAVVLQNEVNEQVADVANADISAEEKHADEKAVAEDIKEEGLFQQ